MSDDALPTAPADIVAHNSRNRWVLGGVSAAALVGIVLGIIGGANFPTNAPVEHVMSFGITLDLVAVLIATGVGLLTARGGGPAREARVFPWLGLAFAVVAFVAWAATSSGLFATLGGGRGRYMYDTAGAFYLGAVWTLGGIFSAFGVRTRPLPRHNAAAFAGVALWAVVLVGVVTSALLYGLDLTD